jgi:hypothetical protein
MPFRVELELRSRFLAHYGIKDPYDFEKLVEILPRRHIWFVRLNRRKLTNRLQRFGFSAEEIQAVLEFVASMGGDLWPTLNYLRQEVQMKNARRIVEPLDLNAELLRALKQWAAQWPRAPKKLGQK